MTNWFRYNRKVVHELRYLKDNHWIPVCGSHMYERIWRPERGRVTCKRCLNIRVTQSSARKP